MHQLNLRKIPIEKLNPAPYHPREDLQAGHPVYERLLESVEEFGYVQLVVWNERTGNIVGGHQRFKILQQLGYTEIDCVVVDLDDLREKTLNVALNKISGNWDVPKLTDLVKGLEDGGMRYELTGFTRPELDELYKKMQRERGKLAEDDFDTEGELSIIETPITQLGDIWLLGRHRLLCGDSTSAEDVGKLMEGKKAKMVFTDPPWNVDYGGAAHPSWKQRTIMNDKMSTDDFYKFLSETFKNMAAVSEKGALSYIVMSAQEWGNVMTAMRENNYHWSSTIIWAKNSLVLSRKDYHTQYEPIWYGWLEGAARLCPLTDKKQSDLWHIDRPRRSPDHPTTKPIALAGKAIGNSSRNGDLVLDLFGGSGTTLIASEQLDRVCHMMELDPKYADVIVKRAISQFETDEDVFLIRDGEKIPWADVPQPPQAEGES